MSDTYVIDECRFLNPRTGEVRSYKDVRQNKQREFEQSVKSKTAYEKLMAPKGIGCDPVIYIFFWPCGRIAYVSERRNIALMPEEEIRVMYQKKAKVPAAYISKRIRDADF